MRIEASLKSRLREKLYEFLNECFDNDIFVYSISVDDLDKFDAALRQDTAENKVVQLYSQSINKDKKSITYFSVFGEIKIKDENSDKEEISK